MRGLARALGGAVRRACAQFSSGFTSLRGSPRELYVIFALKILESYNYFSLSRLFTLYLSEEFGIPDMRAGFYYGLWGTLLTAYGFLLGGLIDLLGVRGSLVICFLLNITSRFVMAWTSSRVLLLVMLLGPNAVAGALGVPVMTIGIKRYTHEGNRGFAFALFYSLMNCAALSQGMLMDVFRIGFKHGFNIPSLPERSLLNSGSRLFLASGCLTSLAGLLVSLTLSEDAHGTAGAGPGAGLGSKRTSSDAAVAGDTVHSHRTDSSLEVELPTSPEVPLLSRGTTASEDREVLAGTAGGGSARHRAHGGEPAAGGKGGAAEGSALRALQASAGADQQQLSGGSSRRQRMDEFWAGGRIVLSSQGFYKYLLMCLFTVNLKSVFRHLDATLPKYQLRAFGCDTPIGLIYSINPAMIVLLVPVVGALTTELNHFDMIHYGGWVSALSPFFIVAFNTEWSTAAFVALLSLGEAIWSPRWYDYSMSVAPVGREGIFTALASAPLFAAMLPTGMISGALLQNYCPDNGLCGDRNKDGGSPADGSSSGSGGGGGGAAGAGRRLLALLSGSSQGSSSHVGSSSSDGGGASSWARSLAAAAGAEPGGGGEGGGGGPADPGEYVCDGRSLWLIVGLITLSSPLLVMLTQRWLKPGPRDFARLDAAQRARGTTTEGECFDTNEADPLGLLENVYESRLLHDAESGSGAVGDGGRAPGSGTASGSGGQEERQQQEERR